MWQAYSVTGVVRMQKDMCIKQLTANKTVPLKYHTCLAVADAVKWGDVNPDGEVTLNDVQAA